jgi:hypothetical protein
MGLILGPNTYRILLGRLFESDRLEDQDGCGIMARILVACVVRLRWMQPSVANGRVYWRALL